MADHQRDITRNFRASAIVGTGWFALMFVNDVRRAGELVLSTTSTATLYLLFAVVEAMLLVLSFIRQDLPARLLTGFVGALPLLILAALAYFHFTRPGGLSCWTVENVALPLYIGGSHLAYAMAPRTTAK